MRCRQNINDRCVTQILRNSSALSMSASCAALYAKFSGSELRCCSSNRCRSGILIGRPPILCSLSYILAGRLVYSRYRYHHGVRTAAEQNTVKQNSSFCGDFQFFHSCHSLFYSSDNSIIFDIKCVFRERKLT